MKRTIVGWVVFGIILSGAGCATMNNTEQGATIGAIGGALIGSLIGDSTGDAITGAIIGAAIGGAAGAFIGSYMDRQAAALRQDVPGAEVDRVGEGILVSFDMSLFFAAGGFELLLGGRQDLDRMAIILNRYPDCHVFVEGRAFVPGTYEPDIQLGERRARVMADYMRGQNVRADRFTIRGYSRGQSGGSFGRIPARRMGMAIMADDNLRRTARAHAR